MEIVKSRMDKREYRRIVLPNSLEVLLISDPEADKAAASMSVSVGSFSDPDGLEGLAHFLEHMLFYASEKYPTEGSYSKYISEHGGSDNAYTDTENTNYHFDVNADCFEEALDRFAQFFINPLMSADGTLRELKAVDSENQNNLLSDSWRMYQLEKHISSEDHPYHKFSTGNWDTLEVIPRSKGLDTREELIKFYKEHYSANLMHLVVYGKEDLDEIQRLVEEKFIAVPNNERTRLQIKGQPCAPEHLQIVVKAVPIKQGDFLRVVWPIPPSIKNYKEAPCIYIGHLIGHEGVGSLYFVLKMLGWALSMDATEGEWSDDFSFLMIVIELTDAGHEHVQDIVGLIFKYISLLNGSGLDRWIFDELAAICEIGFHYKDKIDPIDYVCDIASSMELYPPEDWLTGSSLPSKFVPSSIQTTLDHLTPTNVRIFWESRKFDGYTDSIEPWFGTKYSIERVECSTIQQWIEAAPSANLHLPAPNVFIPRDFAIKDMVDKKIPTVIWKSSFSRLWYKRDTVFLTPKAYVSIEFCCPYLKESPEASVLTDIFTSLLMDYLNEYAYNAQVAGLYYGINNTDKGFQVVISGYNHKMRILLERIIFNIANFEVKSDRFSVIKECLIKAYKNTKFQQPYEQASYYCLLLLHQSWPWDDELEVIPHLEPNDLAKFLPHLLSKCFVESYISGNIESNEAKSLIQHIEEVLFTSLPPICKALLPSQYFANRIVKLGKGKNYYYPVEVLNQSDENSALLNYIQVHQDDVKMNVKLQLFTMVAKQPAFHQLRTVEQLGYITDLGRRNHSGVRGVVFTIQSTVKDPTQLNARVNAFLEKYVENLQEMSTEEFEVKFSAHTHISLPK